MHGDRIACLGTGWHPRSLGDVQPHCSGGPVPNGQVGVDWMLGSGWKSHNFERTRMPFERCQVQCRAVKTRAVAPASIAAHSATDAGPNTWRGKLAWQRHHGRRSLFAVCREKTAHSVPRMDGDSDHSESRAADDRSPALTIAAGRNTCRWKLRRHNQKKTTSSPA